MAVIKCKMCGAGVEMAPDQKYGTCEHCNNIVTFPKISDDQRLAAYDRGDHFRRNGDFDKALAVYEQIIRDDPSDAEAHWCCVLCRFGIEYVQNPGDSQWIPTCHRASFDSILEDVDYQAALEYSDGVTRNHYQAEAKRFSEIQKGILAISRQEDPYDIFICYKESDGRGGRTQDSVLAQDIYYQLMDAGYRIFFSRITLEDKAGTEYEPYIFAALHSAKVMLVVGTRQEYFNAVWVRNEWGRFLAMMRKDKEKLLIPCYRDMDPYDLPEALSILQAYDMSKIGFVQDLLRGLKKILYKEEEKSQQEASRETVVIQGNSANVQALLKRGYIELEDENWEKADEFFEQVLNNDPENAEAYLGKFYTKNQRNSLENVLHQHVDWSEQMMTDMELLPAASKLSEEVQRMIREAAFDIQQYQENITQKLQKLSTTYPSRIKRAERNRGIYQALIEEDKNLSRAKRYSAEGDTVSTLLEELEKKFSEQIEEARREAEQAQKETQAKYDRQFQKIRCEVEYERIIQECQIDSTWFANNRKTAEKFQREQKTILEIYKHAGKNNIEETYQKIQELSLELYDKEEELKPWSAAASQWKTLTEQHQKEVKEAQLKLDEARKKRDDLIRETEWRQSQVETKGKNNVAQKNTVISFAYGMIQLLAVIFVICTIVEFVKKFDWSKDILQLVGILLIAAFKNFSLFIVCAVVIIVVAFLLHLILGQMGERQEKEIKEENGPVLNELGIWREKVRNQEQELAEMQKRHAKALHAITLPKAKLKMISDNVLFCRPYDALEYVSLDQTELTFRQLHVHVSESSSAGNSQAFLFCYEKESFYPVEILREADGENPDQLVLTVTNMGLSVKLEKFSDREHYLLLY